MRRSQGRRSSNTLPIRALPGVGSKPTATTSSVSTGGMASAQKRSSSIPRPSSSSSSAIKSNYGQRQDQSLALGMTPSKSGSAFRLTTATPQMGGTTPQSRGNTSISVTSKPFLKETRNLSDKNCVLEMMKNVATFLNDAGFPECVTHKEIQKIDKQSFIKYFNFIFQFIDSNFQLGPRFNEDELIRIMKDTGYCGTLTKSALVSIGALHSTSQIVGLLSWLSDLVRILMAEPDDGTESTEKAELKIMMRSYNAWCMNQPFDLVDEFRTFYKEKHHIEDGRAEMIDRQIQAIIEEYKTIEKKSFQIEELKADAKNEERKLEEISAREVQLQQRLKELQNEEKHLLQRLEEIEEKTKLRQTETAELVAFAKNSKVSADEARRIKSAIATNKRDYAAASEQREQVAKLVEKREMQLANIAAEDIKFVRELNVDLMDMGMTIEPDMDYKEAVKNFLDCKTAALADTESRCIAMNEKKERTLAEISQLRMELKHSELLNCRMDERLESVKADRDEMERLYLSQLAELESLSTAPRSDPLLMRKQYELETLQQRFAEQKALMNKQEKELQETVARNTQELKDVEAQYQKVESNHADFMLRLGDGFNQILELLKEGPVSEEVAKKLLPEPTYELK